MCCEVPPFHEDWCRQCRALVDHVEWADGPRPPVPEPYHGRGNRTCQEPALGVRCRKATKKREPRLLLRGSLAPEEETRRSSPPEVRTAADEGRSWIPANDLAAR